MNTGFNQKDLLIKLTHLENKYVEKEKRRSKKMSKCWLHKKPFRQCCCNCANLLKLNLHCSEVIHKPDGCVCDIQIGWVCVAFGSEGIAHLFRHQHSVGCEMYAEKQKSCGNQNDTGGVE